MPEVGKKFFNKRKSSYPSESAYSKRPRQSDNSFKSYRSTDSSFGYNKNPRNSGYTNRFRGNSKSSSSVSSFRPQGDKSRKAWLGNVQVSGDTCRGSIKIFPQSMAKNNSRSLGSFSNERGPKIGIHFKTTLLRSSTNKCLCPKFKYFTVGGRQVTTKRCNRTCPFRPNANRFLFNIFPCHQENRRIKASDKSETIKQVSAETAFQNGLFKQGQEPSSTRRLGNFPRFKRCISSYSSTCGSQKVPTFLHKRKSIPVHLPLFWVKPSAQEFHKNSDCNSSTSQNAEFANGSVSRRLVSGQSGQTNVDFKQEESPQSSSRSRVLDKSRKIFSHSKSTHNIHRGSFPFRQGNSVSNSRKDCEDRTSNSLIKERSNSSKFPSFVGANGLMHRHSSKRSPIHEATAAPSSTFLEASNKGSPSQNSGKQVFVRPLQVVAKQTKFDSREMFHSKREYEGAHNRRLEARFWRPFGKPGFSRFLDKKRETTSHKLSRVGSSFSVCPSLSPSTQRPQCIDQVRQYNCGPIYQQTGGNKVSSPLFTDMEFVGHGNSKQDSILSSSSGRQIKFIGGRFVQSKDSSNRMDSKRCHSESDFPSLGYPNDRSFCIRYESQSPNVLLLDSQSNGTSNRCFVNSLGEHGSLCFSSFNSNSQSSSAYEEISVPANSDRTPVAQEDLVHRSSSDVDRLPASPTYTAELALSAKDKDIPPEPTGVQSCCMEAISRSFKKKGFSEKSRSLLAASWRAGTQKDYSVKFNKFHSWCCERDIDPYQATLAQCADFLSCLFQSGLKYRTIAGYRSMLSAMLPSIDNIPVGQHPHIIRLLKGVFNSRPPQRRLVPEWNLERVLDLLSGPLFEPLSKIALKFLTWKTVFLIAVTTFRRCGDIQALSIAEGFMSIVPEGIIFIREGLAKQDRPGHQGSKILVPCFRQNSKLDPKRALQNYLKRTEKLRNVGGNVETRLFLSFQKPHKVVSRQTIALWIVNIIRLAYGDSEKSRHILHVL